MSAPHEKRRWRLKFSLLFLLSIPSSFAMGWFFREWTFERDVEAEALQIVTHVNGHFVPELGVIIGGKDAYERYKEISAQDDEEVRRRIEFFRRLRGGSSDTTPWPTSPRDESEKQAEP